MRRLLRIRIVPDTNILISALIAGGNEYLLVEKCFKKEVQLLTSPDILDEFREVALRPKFGLSAEKIDEFVGALIEAAEVVVPQQKVTGACRDPDDEKVLEAALEGKADSIVSGDKDLLVLKKFRNVAIATAAEFLKNQKKPRRR